MLTHCESSNEEIILKFSLLPPNLQRDLLNKCREGSHLILRRLLPVDENGARDSETGEVPLCEHIQQRGLSRSTVNSSLYGKSQRGA